MTAWIPDVVADENIEHAWGNLIRDRTVHPFADIAARAAAIPIPILGQACFVDATNGFYVYDGTNWRGLPRGRIANSTFGAVNLSAAGDFVTFNITLAEQRIIQFEYLFNCEQQTSNANITIQLAVTGQTARRIFNRAGVVVGESLIPGGGPVAGSEHYNLVAGTYACAIHLTTVSAGASRGDTAWNNHLTAYDHGSP